MTRPGRTDRALGWRARVPTILACVFVLVGLMSASAAFSQGLRSHSQPLRFVIDRFLLPAPANLAYAAFLFVVASAVARRKLLAYRILLAYFGLLLIADVLIVIGSVVHDVRPADVVLGVGGRRAMPWWEGVGLIVGTLLVAATLVVLVLARRAFYARVQRASLLRAVIVLVVGFVLSVGIGYALVSAAPGSIQGSGARQKAVFETVLGGAFRLSIHRHGHAPGWVNLLLGLMGAATLFAAVLTLFRAQRVGARLTGEDERRIRALLAPGSSGGDAGGDSGGGDSLGYFATRRDKSALFSPSGKAGLTYRVVAGVSLASGDPIGDREAWPAVVEAWLDQAYEYAWRPAVLGASEAGARVYQRAGLRVLRLGDEAVLETATFSLDGRAMRPVRQAVTRVERAGYRFRVRRHADVPAGEMAQVVRLSELWRDTQDERGYSMALSRLGDPADGDCVLVEAWAPGPDDGADARLVAVLSFVPWGSDGLSLDLMRRAPDAENGVMEFLVARLIRAVRPWGIERVSLNFAVFRSAFEEGARVGAGPVIRAWRALLMFLSRWWQLESLYRSNAKYLPRWVPRFLCFDDRRDLAQVAFASALAEGLIDLPTLRSVAAGLGVGRGRRGASAVPAGTAPSALSVPPPLEEPAPAPTRPAPTRPAPTRPAPTRPAPTRPAPTRPEPDAVPGGPEPDAVPEVEATAPRATHRCAEAYALAQAAPDGEPGPGPAPEGEVVVTGTVRRVRSYGRLVFAVVADPSGELQLVLSADATGREALSRWRSRVAVGASVVAAGRPERTRKGEPSLFVRAWWPAAGPAREPAAGPARKGAAEPPDREFLAARTELLGQLRNALRARGFVEVEPGVEPSADRAYTTRGHGGIRLVVRHDVGPAALDALARDLVRTAAAALGPGELPIAVTPHRLELDVDALVVRPRRSAPTSE